MKFLLPLALSMTLMADFLPTSQSYTPYEDFDAICKSTFGPQATVAQWQDIKKAYKKAEDKKKFLEDLDLKRYDQSYIIENNTTAFFEAGDRHYILTYHNHNLPTNYTYLVHDTIDDHMLDLGSWRDFSYPVLCNVPSKRKGN
ncbi:hypothetical protein [Nitratiruptor tergarcus]|uniref:Uncharacterized protein n=1 Tax=Nitratiruptor tergarcus DSM 16512 TaxID=1069081 RepID=A0A1W1WQJ5_9BACT|nr:hypothetical protein [Nitratiruptor tergarcus]SMC08578.1 hypothetical protein SAMN05660197_0335 [Nitratiruptor tergarcus DSM 16512]